MTVERQDRFVTVVSEVARALVEAPDPVATISCLVEGMAAVIDGAEAGAMVADTSCRLRVVGSSNERLRILEMFEIQHSEGPCPDAFRSSSEVLDQSLSEATARWPHLSPLAESLGFRRASAMPLKNSGLTVGAVNLFIEQDRDLTTIELAMARSLADLATLTILWDSSALTVTQLQRALDSRIIVEQAKGALASQLGIGTDEAFEMLRSYSRRTNRLLTDVGQDLLNGIVPVELAAN